MSALITADQFNVRDLPPIWGYNVHQNWVVQDLIPAESVILFTGESGSGKSTVLLALAQAVAKGEPFLDFTTAQRPVLIVDKENGLSVYHERLKRFNIEPDPNLLFWGHWCSPEPAGPDCASIARFAKEERPLIIFDSLVAFHPGSEQDATETRKFMEWFRKLTGLGATVILIHHTGKGENTKDYRGSSDIKASIDVGLVLTAKKPLLKLLQIKPFKTREGVLEPIYLKVEDTRFVVAEDKAFKEVLEAIGANPGCNQTALVKLLSVLSLSSIRRSLIKGEENGQIKVVKGQKNATFYYLSENNDAQ